MDGASGGGGLPRVPVMQKLSISVCDALCFKRGVGASLFPSPSSPLSTGVRVIHASRTLYGYLGVHTLTKPYLKGKRLRPGDKSCALPQACPSPLQLALA